MSRILKLLALASIVCAWAAGPAAAASSPTVLTGRAEQARETSVVLTGTVNPNGAITHWQFAYGLTTAYGSTTTVHRLSSTKSPTRVSITVRGLSPGSTYHFQILAYNRYGQAKGADRTFKTTGHPVPGATTEPATNIAQTSATLNGIVTTNDQATTYYFQYGTSTSYTAQTLPQAATASTAPTSVSQTISGLSAGALFHYRLVAVNRGFRIYGNDETLFTMPSPAPTPTVHGHTRPKTLHGTPYVFTTSGKVSGPSSIPAQYACTQSVTIKYHLGRRVIKTLHATLAPDCTFAAQATFKHRPGGRKHSGKTVKLTVTIHFVGNGYLAASDSKKEHVKVAAH